MTPRKDEDLFNAGGCMDIANMENRMALDDPWERLRYREDDDYEEYDPDDDDYLDDKEFWEQDYTDLGEDD
jgi:hypothetical protein